MSKKLIENYFIRIREAVKKHGSVYCLKKIYERLSTYFVDEFLSLFGIICNRKVSFKKWKEDIQTHEANYWSKGLKRDPQNFYYHRFTKELLRQFLPENLDFKDKLIVDLGGGPKGVISLLENGKKITIDSLAHYYKKSGLLDVDKFDCSFIQAVGERLPLKDKSIDFLICTNALDHMFDPKEAINEVRRVLKDKGYFLLDVMLYEKEGTVHPFNFSAQYINMLTSSFKGIKKRILIDKNSPERFIGLFQKLNPSLILRQSSTLKKD